MADSPILDGLNEQQRTAVMHGGGPLLIIAGAGTGKTKTLVHRVARTIEQGIDPRRVLLLTFTRRAAAEMLRRVDHLLRQLPNRRGAQTQRVWGGTFHATASGLLRTYGKAVDLDPNFTIHDRGDSEDLLDVVRTELGLAKTDTRFPRKATCMAIYSHCVNARRPIDEVLGQFYPWCKEHVDALKELFKSYVDRKTAANVLDYDDLLLFWNGLLTTTDAGKRVRERYDAVFVDEYQDTNRLQAEILKGLRPDGDGLTVVGDDAQSIYSFRAATVKNILDFPAEFPGTSVIKLEQNYRSSQPILTATNLVIANAKRRYEKQLWSTRDGGAQPQLVTCEDEDEQAAFVVRRVLELRESGIDLKRQAVLFRASHHSILLEAELARHNIPFVKYGGLKFLETAHVKDLMSFLRLAENPRDVVAGCRVLMLLPGIGPKKSHQYMERLSARAGDFSAWLDAKPPAGADTLWPELVRLMTSLVQGKCTDVAGQIHQIRLFYGPLLEQKYDQAGPRLRDLEQLELLATRYRDRATMLSEMALDPPSSTEDLAGEPLLDEDYLILSTIHSAKGLEWDAVYVIHASDGNIPSDMATGSEEEIEEERRLFYVALTRAKDWLTVLLPQRYYYAWSKRGDNYGYGQVTRFIDSEVRPAFECRNAGLLVSASEWRDDSPASKPSVRAQLKAMWD